MKIYLQKELFIYHFLFASAKVVHLLEKFSLKIQL